MKFEKLAEQIIELQKEDLALRDKLIESGELNEGYNEEMAKLHTQNAAQLDDIIDRIGYPTIDKVGKEASEAAWLVIQHAIGQPGFMKKCLQLLESAVSEEKANPKNLAYLIDRIATFEGKPQRYGTSFDWDENGQLNPHPFDDLAKVNQRRQSIGLNTMEEQTQIMRRQAEHENLLPPADMEERTKAYDKWRKTVGWIG